MQHENKLQFTPLRERLIICIAMGVFPLMGMGIDLIAPSLPAISKSLQVSEAFSKDLIALFLLGYGIGCFCLGFLSDAWGRRKLTIAGFVIFVLASLLPVFFPQPEILLIARFIQGISLGAATLMRVMLADILPAEKLVHVATYISTMWGIGPIIGPIIGGYLQYYIGWQACFIFFALYGVIITLAVIFIIPETNLNKHSLEFSKIKNNISTVISHAHFMGVVTTMGITYSTLIVFNTLGPFLIQLKLGHSPVYFGHIALGMGIMFLLGTMTCRQLVKKYSPENIFSVAIPLGFIIGLAWLILSLFLGKNIFIIVVPSLLMFFVSGLIFPAAMGRGLALFRHLAGTSSAVMNLMNLSITSLTAFVMSFILINSALVLACIYIALILLTGLTYHYLIRKNA